MSVDINHDPLAHMCLHIRDARQAMALYNAFQLANASNYLNFTFPPGTAPTLAYQPVRAPSSIAGIDHVAGTRSSCTHHCRIKANGYWPGSAAHISATVPYFSPSVACSPVFSRINFSIPLSTSPRLTTVEQGNSHVAIQTNYTLRYWTKYDEMGSPIESYYSTTSAINFTVQADNWSGHVSIPEMLPLNKTNCRLYSQSYRSGCGQDKADTWLINYEMMIRDDCADEALVLVHRECRDADHTVANFTATLVKCQPDDTYGDATIRFQNGKEISAPKITVLNTSTNTGIDNRPIGNDLMYLLLQGIEMQCIVDCTAYLLPFLNETTPTPDEGWLDAGHIYQTLRKVYPNVAVQIFRLAFFAPSNATVSAMVEGES